MTYVALQWLFLVVGLVIASGSLLSLSRHPHWFVRGWDFPRIQIAGIIGACLIGFAGLEREWDWFAWPVVVFLAACLCWHLCLIVRYTPLWHTQVKRSNDPSNERTLRLVISNVQMQNREFDRWKEVVLADRPDAILAVETDDQWCNVLRGLQDEYPYQLLHPQDNMYGMALVSKLELVDAEVKFIVDKAYPSIHTKLRLRSGDTIVLRGVHPPPPEPIRNKSARERDAELLIIGRDWIGREEATIIAGDLNDVAWSHSTRLFQRISGMLDPRIGRGFFNSWDVNSYWRRAPLDHVFNTDHFRLRSLRRLDAVGSDHFPMLIEVTYEPEGEHQQEEQAVSKGDEAEAEDKIDDQREHGGVRSQQAASARRSAEGRRRGE